MREEWTLKMLKPGQTALVKLVSGEDGMHRRLMDLGLVENTKVECIDKKTKFGLSAYMIRGSVIAIRGKDAQLVVLQDQKWDGTEDAVLGECAEIPNGTDF